MEIPEQVQAWEHTLLGRWQDAWVGGSLHCLIPFWGGPTETGFGRSRKGRLVHYSILKWVLLLGIWHKLAHLRVQQGTSGFPFPRGPAAVLSEPSHWLCLDPSWPLLTVSAPDSAQMDPCPCPRHPLGISFCGLPGDLSVSSLYPPLPVYMQVCAILE